MSLWTPLGQNSAERLVGCDNDNPYLFHALLQAPGDAASEATEWPWEVRGAVVPASRQGN